MIRKTLFTIIVWLFGLSTFAQTLTVTKEFTLVPNSSVLAMYKNQFGKWEKPDMDDTFPYAVIRMRLEGSAREVTIAKQRLTLYLGTQTAVVDRYAQNSNELLFLVPARRPTIYIDCGDGCDKVLLMENQQLQSNRVYDGVVHFVPEEIDKENVDREELKKELLAELSTYLSEKKEKDSSNNENEVKFSNEPQNHITQNINQHNGHDYVDLGLSVKWATCNVGATKPEDFGDYFAWGETEPKRTYKWRTYKWCINRAKRQTKYCTKRSYGTVDNKTTLELSDDAARANWGGSWRMPTDAELTELREQCTWTWTSQNGVYGHKVTSKKNGNSIFLPAAGYRNDSSLDYAGSSGYFWSNSLGTDGPYYACGLGFFLGDVYRGNYSRHYGRSVRPVCQ
jgi:hypothetical protein